MEHNKSVLRRGRHSPPWALRSSDSMKKMERALTKEGYLVLNVDYPSRTAGTEELSMKVIGDALRSDTLAGVSSTS